MCRRFKVIWKVVSRVITAIWFRFICIIWHNEQKIVQHWIEMAIFSFMIASIVTVWRVTCNMAFSDKFEKFKLDYRNEKLEIFRMLSRMRVKACEITWTADRLTGITADDMISYQFERETEKYHCDVNRLSLLQYIHSRLFNCHSNVSHFFFLFHVNLLYLSRHSMMFTLQN